MNGVAAGSPAARLAYERAFDVRTPGRAPIWVLLGLRSALAVAFQATLAMLFLLGGASDPWRASADWWLAWFAVVSVVNLAVVRGLLHAEGRRLRDLYRFNAAGRGRDLAWVAVALLVSGPLAMLPNLLVGQALWGSAQAGADLSFRALPLAAAVTLVIAFPVIHAMAELPTYFGYVMPRLEAAYGWRWRAWLIAALVLSAQHMVLPLLFDWRFLAWRAVMFLPFALWIGFVIRRRPTALPYLVIGHAVLDTSLPVLVVMASL